MGKIIRTDTDYILEALLGKGLPIEDVSLCSEGLDVYFIGHMTLSIFSKHTPDEYIAMVLQEWEKMNKVK